MTDSYNMDGHKLLWHLDRLDEFSKGVPIAPLHIDLGITTGCNMACTYCYGVIQKRTGYGTDYKNRFDMPKGDILRLLKDSKDVGVRSIAFVGEGDNTLNPALWEALDYAKDINLDVSLATNGIILPENKIDNMLEAVTWVRINLSAATGESFQKIHNVSQLDRVLLNIENLVKSKKKNNLETAIGLQMVVMDDNVPDIVPLAKLGSELGVDYFVIKACSDTNDHVLNSPEKHYYKYDEIFKEAETYSNDSYQVIVKWKKLQNQGQKDFDVCYGTQFILAISGDGSVFPCGHWFNIEREKFLIGNITNNSFKELFQSDRYWEVQKLIQTVNVNKDCESNCRQYYINRTLQQIKSPPKHLNFI